MLKLTVILGVLLSLVILVACAGPAGPRGYSGAPGETGAVGPQGPAIPVYSAPASPQQCPTGGVAVTLGTSVFVICNGATGASGANGQNGSNGTNATPVTTVQFCPNVTPTYPSSFPEYGICIGGNLYGVYSANDGFLALLPPGEYSSDGINASCDFTITADCGVIQ